MNERKKGGPGKPLSPPETEAARTQGTRAAHVVPAAVTLSQSVTDRLRAAILEGRFLPHEKLHEMSLSAMLGASRTPVRTALHSLTGEGLLEYVPNRGYSVRGMEIARLLSAFDVRGMLEGLAARLAAENGMDEAARAEFRLGLEQGDRIIGKGTLLPEDREPFGELNARLHEAILQAADNQLLIDMIRMCQNIPISSDRNVMWSDFRWIRRSHDDHYRVFDAILARDGSRAELLMREHVLTVKLHMKEQLERLGA